MRLLARPPRFVNADAKDSSMPFPPTHPALARALEQHGYVEPTPVQAAVLDAGDGQDLLVSAQTGSGKTVAFGLAMARDLLGEAPRFERPARRWPWRSRRRGNWRCRSAANSAGSTPNPGRRWPTESAAWTRGPSAGCCKRGVP